MPEKEQDNIKVMGKPPRTSSYHEELSTILMGVSPKEKSALKEENSFFKHTDTAPCP